MDWQNLLKDVITYFVANFPSFVAIVTVLADVYRKTKSFNTTVESENNKTMSANKQNIENVYKKMEALSAKYEEATKNYYVALTDVTKRLDEVTSENQKYALQMSAVVQENEKLRRTIAVLLTNDNRYLSADVLYGLNKLLTEKNNMLVEQAEYKEESVGAEDETEELQSESDNL